MMMLQYMARGFLLCVFVCVGAACSKPAYERVSQSAVGVSTPAPTPSQAPILTVSGRISLPNQASSVALDMPTLESLGLVKYKVFDPWLNVENEYTGILLSDLLQTVGAEPNASTIHFTALDDYAVDIKMSDVRKWPILLATRTNGNYMSVADKGPTRIVFPTHAYSDIDQLLYKDLWVWQIKTMEVR